MNPKYPIYVPSKGRSETCYTAKFLIGDGTPFRLVVEPQEAELYGKFGRERILTLPWRGDDSVRRKFCAQRVIENGGLVAARNWIKEHSIAEGHARHWQLDDNIRYIMRRFKTLRLRCDSGPAFRAVEDFTDRFENVAVSGMNYAMFCPETNRSPPFVRNVHVYSCTLINNAIQQRWRIAYNDDTDLCLQVLASGMCTILVNTFLCHKLQTMTVRGGNTNDLYGGDGRLKMARSLERLWPGVVQVRRRFGRPQHVIVGTWAKFDTPLKLRAGVKLPKGQCDYGMKLQAVSDVKSSDLRKLLEANR